MEHLVLPEKWIEWTITEKIGSGAYGTVYRAEKKNGEMCAIKIIQIPRKPSEMDALQREYGDWESVNTFLSQVVQDFEAEIDAMECLKDNEHIVQIQDYQVIRSVEDMYWKIYIRMEYLKTLFDYKAGQGMGEEEVRKLGMDICHALCACEEQHILHRDIKPDNIMVSKDGNFKLGDFGVARHMDRTTSSLSLKGTFSFMAPEVYYGKRYDKTADIYSLGLVMYRLLNNNRDPFVDPSKRMVNFKDRQDAMNRRMQATGEMPAPVNASEMMGKIILKACAHDKELRFSSEKEFLMALETMTLEKEETTIPQSVTKNPTDISKKTTFGEKKLRWIAGMIGAVAVLAAVVGVFSQYTAQSKPTTIHLNDYIKLEFADEEDIYDGEGYAVWTVDKEKLEEDYGELLRENLLKNKDSYIQKNYTQNSDEAAQLTELLNKSEGIWDVLDEDGYYVSIEQLFLYGYYDKNASGEIVSGISGCIDSSGNGEARCSILVNGEVGNDGDRTDPDLKNGDVVSLDINIDNLLAEELYGVHLEYEKVEATEQGLKDFAPDSYQWITSAEEMSMPEMYKMQSECEDTEGNLTGWIFMKSKTNQENRLFFVFSSGDTIGSCCFKNLFYDDSVFHYAIERFYSSYTDCSYDEWYEKEIAPYADQYDIVVEN